MYFDSVSGVRGADSFQSDSIFTLLFMTLITTSLEMFVSCISEAPLFPPSSVLHLSCCDGLLIGEKRVLCGSLSLSLRQWQLWKTFPQGFTSHSVSF